MDFKWLCEKWEEFCKREEIGIDFGTVICGGDILLFLQFLAEEDDPV